MVDKVGVLTALATVIATFLVSTLFAPAFLVIYNIDIQNSTNSAVVKLENIGLIQATNANMFILQTKPANKINTDDCLEGKLVLDKENRNQTEITFDRVSRGISCTILLSGFDTHKISDVIVTSEGGSAFKYSSNSTYLIYLWPFFAIMVAEIIFIIVIIPHTYDIQYGVLHEFFIPSEKERTRLKQIREEIKTRFGITLYFLEIAILVELNTSPIPTILELTQKVNSGIRQHKYLKFYFFIPKFTVKKRLQKLSKMELIDNDRKLNPNIKSIIDSQAVS